MKKHFLSIIALLLVTGLVTDPLAEPAFSTSLSPMWGVFSLLPTNQTPFNQEALTGMVTPRLRTVDTALAFPEGTTPLDRLEIEFFGHFGLPHPAALNREFYQSLMEDLKVGSFESAQFATEEFLPPTPWKITTRPLLNGWVADFNQKNAASALKNYSRHLKEMSIFGVGATDDGHLAPETDFISAALRSIQSLSKRPRAMLTVANIRPNHNQDRWLLEHWLGTAEARGRHIAELLEVVQPVDGLDIDYENLQPWDGPRYSEFIRRLGQALHARHKLLTVTLEPQALTEGNIDWKIIRENVDRVRVMAYQFHYDRTNPGAVSPPAIVRKLAMRALKLIPLDKLEIALPIYGFDWDTSQTHGDQGHGDVISTIDDFRQLARQRNAWVFRDPITQSARVDYFDASGPQSRPIRHEVWFEDPVSVAYKVRQLQQMGITHLGLWQIGVGDISDLFKLLKMKSSKPVAAANTVKFSTTDSELSTNLHLMWTMLTLTIGCYDYHISSFIFSSQTAMPLTAIAIDNATLANTKYLLLRVIQLLPAASQIHDVAASIIRIALAKAF